MIEFYFFILILYSSFILTLAFSIKKKNTVETGINSPLQSFSIIVPFRNEETNLPFLIESFQKLKYPKKKFEIILVDDHSFHPFILPENIENKISIRIIPTIRKSNSPKKDAIDTALSETKHKWVITTDADCIVPDTWLQSYNNCINFYDAEMVASGVYYISHKGFIYDFQSLDFLSLQGTTVGSFSIGFPFMCNGANLAYKKKLFYELNGFEGNNELASGDDVFLLQKAVKTHPEKVFFNTDNLCFVKTQPVHTWKELFQQRVRWAAKTSHYNLTFPKILGLIVFTTNLCLVLGIFLFLSNNFSIKKLLFFSIAKICLDAVLLYKTALFFNLKIKNYFTSSLIYPFFSTIVGLYSLIGTFEWKGRRFKK